MKILLPLIAALALVSPVSGQEVRHHERTTTTVHVQRGRDHFRGGFRERGHEHFRGHRFHGYHYSFRHGYFYGEIIVLDDGCWFWNGFEWIVFTNCEEVDEL